MEYARKLYSFLVGPDGRKADGPATKNSPIRGGHRLWCGLQWSLIIFDLHTLVLD